MSFKWWAVEPSHVERADAKSEPTQRCYLTLCSWASSCSYRISCLANIDRSVTITVHCKARRSVAGVLLRACAIVLLASRIDIATLRPSVTLPGMHRLNGLVAHLTAAPSSSQQHTNHTTALHNSTSLRDPLHTLSPLVQQLDQALNAATASTASPSIAASRVLPAGLPLDAWLALPAHSLLGSSASISLTQQHVDAFAAVTSDTQWIHSHRAPSLGSPFGRPIVHGFLVLSILTPILTDVLPAVDGVAMTVNYGLDRVRWMQPVCVDEQVVGTVWLEKVEQMKGGAVQNTCKIEVRVVAADGTVNERDKPAMVAVWLTRFFVQSTRQ